MFSLQASNQFESSEGPGSIIQPKKASKPGMLKFTPALQTQRTLQLPFRASRYVGFHADTMILADGRNEKLVMWSLKNLRYTEKWKKKLPPGIAADSDIYLTPTLIICQNDANEDTLTFSHDLVAQKQYRKGYGRVRGALPHGRLVYMKKMSNDTYKLGIYELIDGQQVTNLSRPGEPFQSELISVCSHRPTDWVAVVDRESPSLDVFDSAYNHYTHIDLSFEPCLTNAVASVDDAIIIASQDDLHLFNWSGEKLSEVSREHLGLKTIRGIGWAGDTRLCVAAGQTLDVNFIHLLNVQ